MESEIWNAKKNICCIINASNHINRNKMIVTLSFIMSVSYLGKTFSFPVMIIEAGLEDADWIVCGVETRERVDAGDVEFDLEPSCCGTAVEPVVDKPNPLDAKLLLAAGDEELVIGELLVESSDAGLNGVKGGDTGRAALGVDIAYDVAGVNGTGPGFSCGVIRDGEEVDKDGTVGDVDESAFMIGMSRILGDAD